MPIGKTTIKRDNFEQSVLVKTIDNTNRFELYIPFVSEHSSALLDAVLPKRLSVIAFVDDNQN